MQTKFLTLFVALIATTALWASNVITYTATSQLSETTNTYGKGLHTNAFNVAISSHTFSNGTGTITFAGEVTTIGDCAFYECSGLTSVTIPNSVTMIGNNAFYGCSGFTSVTIPSSVTTIGGFTFSGCSGLTSVTIPNSVTTIGDNAFYWCSGLTSITIPNSVTTIGEYAFYGCSGLTSVTIPNSVTTIGKWAFWCVNNIVYNGTATGSPWSAKCVNGYVDGYLIYSDATKTTLCGCYTASTGTITIPNSVTTIGEYAFYGCSGLTSVTIPNSVTTIGKEAFYGCSGLKGALTIPNSVTTIGERAFENCSGLTSVTIGNSVTTIGKEAFYGCSGLADIYCYATIPPTCASSDDFSGVSQHCYIHVPAGTVRAYELAVGWSHFLHFFEMSEVPVGGTDQVGVEVTNNTAVFSWPVNPTASSYTLVIKKNDEVFCTLTFNSLGQLVGMAFAPARGANNDSSAQSTAYGYSFMVSNLDASSTYDYTFTAKDASNNVLTTTTGQFKTGDATDLETVDGSQCTMHNVKFIHNGRLLIERNGILYNAHGARVK